MCLTQTKFTNIVGGCQTELIAKSQPKFFCFLHIWCVIQKSSVFTVYTHSLHVRVPRASQGSAIELERVNEMKMNDALILLETQMARFWVKGTVFTPILIDFYRNMVFQYILLVICG